MAYKLEPVELKGIITPPPGAGVLETLFWLIASAMGAQVSVDGVDHEFISSNRGFFSCLQKMGFALGRHIYGADFTGSLKNPVRVDARECEDYLPMLSVLAASANSVLSARIDRPGLYGYCASIRDMMLSLGCESTIISECLYVNGSGLIPGGIVNTKGDYRLVLACLLASCAAKEEISVSHHEALVRRHPGLISEVRARSLKAGDARR